MREMQSFMHDLMFWLLFAEVAAALAWFAVMAGLIFLVWKLFGKNQPTHTVVIRREPFTSENDSAQSRKEPNL